MTTDTTFRRAKTAEAKTLRTRIADLRDQAASLEPLIARVESDYRRACNGGFQNVKPEAAGLHDRLQTLRMRLSRGEDERKDAEQRLAILLRKLGADEAAAVEKRAVAAASQQIIAIEAKLATNASARNRWQAMADESFATAAAARAVLAERARFELPADVRDALGIVGEPPAMPSADPARAEQLAVAAAEAVEKARAADAELLCDLAAARQAEVEARHALLVARAHQAEMAHDEALSVYLPKLVAYRAAHYAALEFIPEMPDFAQYVAKAHDSAVEAAQADPQPTGIMSRIRNAVLG